MKSGKDVYLSEVQKIRYESLCYQLTSYEQRGIKVSVQGLEFPVEKSAMIMSVCDYMPDYDFDNQGKIIGINYDKIVRK